MKQLIRTFALATAVSSALVSQATVTPTDGFTANNWQGTPTYRNYNTTPLNGTGGATVNEQNWGSGGLGAGALLNTFALGTSGNLTSIQLLFGGSASTYDIILYNMGGGYVQSGSSIDPTTLTIVKSVTGLSFTAPNAGAVGVTVIDFTGADSVALAAGNYGLAITRTSATFGWFRGGADTFAGDELYRFDGTLYGPINGSGAPYRHAALAVTVTPVPEPSSMALLGIGALAMIQVIRRKQS